MGLSRHVHPECALGCDAAMRIYEIAAKRQMHSFFKQIGKAGQDAEDMEERVVVAQSLSSFQSLLSK
jgi:hypothetical protein